MNNNIWIVGIFLAVAIIVVAVIYFNDFEYSEPPEPNEIKEEVKPVTPPEVIIKQPHPILGEPYPSPLSDEYLAKWNKCISDETHSTQLVYPEICYTLDGLTARGPLQ